MCTVDTVPNSLSTRARGATDYVPTCLSGLVMLSWGSQCIMDVNDEWLCQAECQTMTALTGFQCLQDCHELWCYPEKKSKTTFCWLCHHSKEPLKGSPSLWLRTVFIKRSKTKSFSYWGATIMSMPFLILGHDQFFSLLHFRKKCSYPSTSGPLHHWLSIQTILLPATCLVIQIF